VRWEPRAAIGPAGPCPGQESLVIHHPAKEKYGNGDSDMGQPRAPRIPDKSTVVERTEVWPASSPQVGMRMRTGEVGGQGQAILPVQPGAAGR